MHAPNPAMLQIAREMRGLTQAALAQESGISQGYISRYENGESPISEDHIQALAKALTLPIKFFYTPGKRCAADQGMHFHRQRRSISATDQKRLDSLVEKFRLEAEELLSRVDSSYAPFAVPQYELQDFSGDIEAVAHAVRNLWEMDPGPVPNVIEELERASCLIYLYDFGTDKMDEVTQWTEPLPPIILVNSSAPGDRQRFNLAHALGHLVLHHNRTPPQEAEEQAHRFAAAFLMPAEDIRDELAPVTIDHMLELKPKWKVSMAALILRARDIGEITEKRCTSLYQMLSRLGYRKNEPIEIEAEKPNLARELLTLYREQWQYSYADLADLTMLHLKEFYERYYPEIRAVG